MKIYHNPIIRFILSLFIASALKEILYLISHDPNISRKPGGEPLIFILGIIVYFVWTWFLKWRGYYNKNKKDEDILDS